MESPKTLAQELGTQITSIPPGSVSDNLERFDRDGRFITDIRRSESLKEPSSSPPVECETPNLKKLPSAVRSEIDEQNDASYPSTRDIPGDLREAKTKESEENETMDKDGSVVDHLSTNLESTESSLDRKPPDSSHLVNFTVTTSFAIPKPPSKEQKKVSEKGSAKSKEPNKVVSSPKAQGYYHMEYFLFPDDAVPIKADVVVFGAVAKLYMENETKVLKPWQEDDKIWLAWTQNIELNVTREFLQKITSYRPMFMMWNTKDKVCSRARFDRPKAFRLANPDEDTAMGTSNLVLKQRKLYEDTQPPHSFISLKDINPISSPRGLQYNRVTELKPLSAGAEVSEKLPPISSAPPSSIGHSRAGDRVSLRSADFIGNLPSLPLPSREKTSDLKHKSDKTHLEGSANKEKPIMTKTETQKVPSLTPRGRGKSSAVKSKSPPKGDKKNAKSAHVPEMKYHFTMQLDLLPLLAGDESVTSYLKEPFQNILYGYVTMAVDAPLLSSEQKQELNPLVIRINSATCLPNTPVPIEVLKAKCLPVYCRYRFHDQPLHQTHDQEHGTHVYFKDVNVILTGTISPGKLREYLRGPPLEIEVHDRDKKMEDFVKTPSLFGSEPEDEKLSNVGLVASKRTVYNPFMEKDKMWNPYGIAKVDLSDLLLGEKYLNIMVPIHSCVAPDPIGYQRDSKSGKIMGVPGSVDGPQGSPLRMGHYLESNSILKLRVDIAVPLTPTSESSDCPYGRLIYIFDNDNTTLLYELMKLIMQINAKALKLDEYCLSLIQECLPKIKLKPEEKGNTALDVITGFHILDGQIHLFILEGLKDKAIKQLWEQTPIRSFQSKGGKLEILYNSDMSFHQRLYEDLDAILYHVQLHEPLSSIVQQPLLYVRDMLPSACFQALSRLDHICHVTKLREVIQGDLLPSVEMVNLLSREFGIPLTKETFLHKVPLLSSSYPVSPDAEENNFKPSAFHVPLDNYNPKYMQWKKDQQISLQDCKDHIKNNIDAVYEMQRKFGNPLEKTISFVPPDGKLVHNYSCQSLNSSELAKKRLRQELAKEPKQIFTYSQVYTSASLEPVDRDDEIKALATKSKDEWLTPDGFIIPGSKSSLECNQHTKKPDEARLADLSKKWKENVLHANILKPTLNRDRWSWMHRHLDFDLYKRPSLFFDTSPPIITHLPGETFKDEQMHEQLDFSKCNAGVDDSKMKIYRCSTEAEQATKGLKAGDQLSKLSGLLKDRPEKLSLRLPDMILKPIPAFAVMRDTEEPTSCGFIPGAQTHHSLKWKTNMIPLHDMEHTKFDELRGKDFNAYCSNHQFLYKRKINELCDEEKKSLIWQHSCKEQPIRRCKVEIKKSRNMVETQAINNVLLHVE
ncbi:uncharacterized protein CFAP92 isoform X2 [Pleurodeles waltl]|uniref:uncharacterized protein CFAP92 isoform X2 n=1 Tax=Pleurodeles waltl TaxID=8319 RepID=UPI003709B99B